MKSGENFLPTCVRFHVARSTLCPAGADWAKARSPKRSDGSLRCPTGESKLLAAQPEAGATWPQAALTDPPTASLPAYRTLYLPWGGEGGDENDAPPAAKRKTRSG